MSVGSELKVKRLPLEVVVVLDVHCTVQEGLADIHEEECRDHWEHQTDPVLGEPEVYVTITLKGQEWVPEPQGRWLSTKWNSFLSETFNILVDMADDLWFNFKSLNHLYNLLLLLVELTVLGTNLLEALIDIVVEPLRHFI